MGPADVHYTGHEQIFEIYSNWYRKILVRTFYALLETYPVLPIGTCRWPQNVKKRKDVDTYLTAKAPSAGTQKQRASEQKKRAGDLKSRIHGFKRDEILVVAARLFFRKGYTATTLDAIAGELGVTKPFIYSYFNDKQDIVKQLYSRTMEQALAAFVDFEPEAYSPSEGIKELVMRFVYLLIATRDGIGFFWRGDLDLPPRDNKLGKEFRAKFEAPFFAVFDRGANSGEFSLPDPNIALKCIEGMVHWIYAWYEPEGRLSEEQLADQVSDYALAMLRAPVQHRATAAKRRSATS